jgi:error-prone DNA polymerase
VAGVVRAFSALKELARLRDEARTEAAEAGPIIRSQRVTDHSSRQTVPHFTGQTDAPAMSDAPLPKLIAGARLVLTDSAVEWLALPTDLAAWSRLTRLLSIGKRRAAKGECHLQRADLVEWGKGMVLIALPPDPLDDPGPKSTRAAICAPSVAPFPASASWGPPRAMTAAIRSVSTGSAVLAQEVNLPMVAVGDVLMHRAARRPLADVLTCLRLGCTIDASANTGWPMASAA